MRIFALLLLTFFCLPVCAETADEARTALSHTLEEMKASDKREKELEAKNDALAREMQQLQETMVSLARDTGDRTDELSSYEEKLQILEDQKKEKTRYLNARQGELSSMVSAMVKLRQLPPEAVIAMPGKLNETLETARALSVITHAVQEEANSLRAQLHELDTLEDKIRHGRAIVSDKKTALTAKQQELATKIKERTQLQAALGGKQRIEKERMMKLTAKSQTLQDLVDTLGKTERVEAAKEQEKEAAPAMAHKHENTSHHPLRSFASAHGTMRLPSGKLVSHFGNTATEATFSKGILIETHADADVVAPFDGEVVFAGNFRDYGHMVILRHSNDYHTLLSGMQQINCTPGQFVLEGEPIGSMGTAPGNNRLYLELRKSGKPMDPMPWFKG